MANNSKKKKLSLIQKVKIILINIKNKIVKIIVSSKNSFLRSSIIVKGISIFVIVLTLTLLFTGLFYKSNLFLEKFLDPRGPTMQSFSNLKKKTIGSKKNIDKNGNFINTFNNDKNLFVQKNTNIEMQMRTYNKYDDDYFKKFETKGPKSVYSNIKYIFDNLNQNRTIMHPVTKDFYINLAKK